MGVPTAEQPPEGLDAHHLGVWRHCLKVLKDQGSWDWELAPLLAEYVYALMGAKSARDGWEWLGKFEQHVERLADSSDPDSVDWTALSRVTARLDRIAGGMPVQWDRHTERAAALADQLALTARGRKAAGIGESDDEQPADPFAEIDAADELAERRGRADGIEPRTGLCSRSRSSIGGSTRG